MTSNTFIHRSVEQESVEDFVGLIRKMRDLVTGRFRSSELIWFQDHVGTRGAGFSPEDLHLSHYEE